MHQHPPTSAAMASFDPELPPAASYTCQPTAGCRTAPRLANSVRWPGVVVLAVPAGDGAVRPLLDQHPVSGLR